ncbi:RrF2 family transcriptional regulator [Ferroacidibacillus organovorans]|uniref:RrF2 family transcriptional regulator n=1 Tax=Ferroacidibacillus organovorans TaxID=1765683 RepID=UPI0009EC9FC2|nr:Rrf2 family transcriptional regulator [Ferroacidibacillus organovorans]
MKVSMRTEYGLRAIVTLCDMSNHSGRAVPLREIAAFEEIPEAFLDQIFGSLRKEGIVQSVRGAAGGYRLTKPAEEISMGQLIQILEGNLAPMACVGDADAVAEEFCIKASRCHTRSVWLRLYESISAVLNNISLAEIVRLESVPSVPDSLRLDIGAQADKDARSAARG